MTDVMDTVFIKQATVSDTHDVALMVGELLTEIMRTIHVQAFNFNFNETVTRLNNFIEQEKYFVFLACNHHNESIGFLTLHESYALYAEGSFGTIPEFYVRTNFRSKNVGQTLLNQARSFGKSRGWKRLEVTTPPLPQFDRTLAFYEREGFSVAGGRKLKALL